MILMFTNVSGQNLILRQHDYCQMNEIIEKDYG